MKNSYTVVNASAGSGKTYFLVQQILLLCLRNPNSEKKIGHILALTFTNKAANEMKERILESLKGFCKDKGLEDGNLKNLRTQLLAEGIHITLEDLQLRAKKLLDYILHHYSILNISTIDKFNTRLIKSFSNELGLVKNFNLEIDADPYLREAIDQLLENIGEDDSYSRLFIDFMNYNFENNTQVKLSEQLFKSSRNFLQDHHYEALKKNQLFDLQHYISKTKELRLEIKEHKNQMKKLCQEHLQKIQDNDLTSSDFSGGNKNGIALFFIKSLNYALNKSDTFSFPGDETDAMATFEKGASSKNKRKLEIEAMVPELILGRKQVIGHYLEMVKKEKILSALLPLKVNKDIQDELTKIETENDVVFLSKFNSIIKENLQNEPSSFIYEKIGTKFQYFFFDEFQDTSLMQWQNFVPLRNNALSMDDTSFTVVGDPKQSIYRFRGGDSQLMLQLINHTEKTPKFADILVLGSNWRSAKNIVKFNNDLYDFHAKNLNPEHQQIFGQDAQQIPEKIGVEGRVKVTLLENSTKAILLDETSQAMHRDIQECIDHGFQLSDITLLCRGNKDILKFSQLLGSKKIQYQGEEIFIKTISEKGLTLTISLTLKALMSFLQWKLNTQNRRFLAKSLYWLQQLGRIHMQDFSKEIFELFQLKNDNDLVQEINNRYHINMGNHDKPQLNLYHFVESYLKEFSVETKETDFILNFLELLHAFTQSSAMHLKDLIAYWEDEGKDTSIQASESIDAVQLMTIHKAKGLEFPVVFYPLANQSKESDINDWMDIDDPLLPNIFISQFPEVLTRYDESINNFNTEHRYENKTDALCVQYVATTRPVEQLFLYLEKPSKNKNNLEIYDFVQQLNLENKDVFDVYEADFSKQVHQEEKKVNTQKIGSVFMDIKTINNIKIATPSKSYQQKNEKVKRGILLHEIISKIKNKKNIARTVEDYVLKGLINLELSKNIEATLHKIVDENPFFFGSEVRVISERDILINHESQSEIYRPDRLLVDQAGNWHIIDFKTGEKKPDHEKQIATYQKVLEKLGHKVLATQIIYFD